jgi:hypothetical protein
MAATILAGALINSALSTSSAVLGTQSNFSSTSFLSLTNHARQLDNEAPLTLNADLTSAAQAKANDMVSQNYWSHTSPSGKTAWDFIIDSGYKYSNAGENLAYGFSSASQVMNGWLSSPDHRANILNNSYHDVGFGVAETNNFLGQGPKVVVAAEYAEPLVMTAAAPLNSSLNQPQLQPVSRFALLTGVGSSWVELALLALLVAAITVLVIRHGLSLRKLLGEGESFITKHPYLDICLVVIATACFVLSRHTGIIG